MMNAHFDGMGKRIAWLAAIGAGMLAIGKWTMADVPFRNAKLPIDRRVDDLLSRMTLDEKIDQLTQNPIGDANPNNIFDNKDRFRPTFGSYIFNQGSLATRIARQRQAVEKSRLGIPAIFAADVIHGYRTIFPIPVASACSGIPSSSAEVAAWRRARPGGAAWIGRSRR